MEVNLLQRTILTEKNDPRRLSVPAPGPYTCTEPLFSNIFSETAWPINAKFHVKPFWGGRTKVYINGTGHMTKMVVMPIYGKNLSKSSSPEPEVL